MTAELAASWQVCETAYDLLFTYSYSACVMLVKHDVPGKLVLVPESIRNPAHLKCSIMILQHDRMGLMKCAGLLPVVII